MQKYPPLDKLPTSLELRQRGISASCKLFYRWEVTTTQVVQYLTRHEQWSTPPPDSNKVIHYECEDSGIAFNKFIRYVQQKYRLLITQEHTLYMKPCVRMLALWSNYTMDKVIWQNSLICGHNPLAWPLERLIQLFNTEFSSTAKWHFGAGNRLE